MSRKVYAIIGITVALAFCFLAFLPVEESDATSQYESTYVPRLVVGESYTISYTFGGQGYWNDQVKSLTETYSIKCTISDLQAVRSGTSYNWAWTVSYKVTATEPGLLQSSVALVTTGGFLSSDDDFHLSGSGTIDGPTPLRTISVSVADPSMGSAIVSSGQQSSSSSIEAPEGNTATFTATPNPGYSFVRWVVTGASVSYHTLNPFNMAIQDDDISAVAYFEQAPVAVTIVSSNGAYGTVSKSTVYVTSGTTVIVSNNHLYFGTTSNNVDATPTTDTAQYDYSFTGWSNVTNGETITASKTITANFTRSTNAYTVSIISNNGSYGTVSTASLTVAYGTSVSYALNVLKVGTNNVTATPSATTSEYSYAFSGWTIPSNTVTSNMTVTANFTRSTVGYTVSFVSNDLSYGSFQPTDTLGVPYGSEISVNGAVITINNVNITAVASASDGAYSYSFDSWDVTDGDTVTEDLTITATFTRASLQHITHWSNDMMNGAVTFVFNWPSSESETHNMSMSLWSGTTNNDYTTTWSDTGYVLNISASYPSTNFAFDLQRNGTSVKTSTVSVGMWSTYELKVDATNGRVIMTPTATFSDFLNYTTLDSQRTVVFDFSDTVRNTAIQVIDHEDTGAGGHARFSVTNTSVFLNTYGVVMNNPTINLYNHFPQYAKLRANFYGFALYGSSFTVNNTTYDVQDGAVTVSYAKNGAGDRVLPSLAPEKPVETRTLALNNISITWDGSHCFLTFESDRFTIDLGSYQQGNELVSFAGLWYFTSILYEPSTTIAKELGEWKMLPDLSWNQMLIIFMGIIVLVGAALYIRMDGSFLDLLLIGGAAVTAFLLIW